MNTEIKGAVRTTAGSCAEKLPPGISSQPPHPSTVEYFLYETRPFVFLAKTHTKLGDATAAGPDVNIPFNGLQETGQVPFARRLYIRVLSVARTKRNISCSGVLLVATAGLDEVVPPKAVHPVQGPTSGFALGLTGATFA
jgi:hypothetical protein